MTTPAERHAPDPGLAVGADRAAGADEIEADIERTREQLVNTVDSLSQRLDVKAQAQRRMQSLGTPRVATIAGAALAAVLVTAGAVLVWRRRRR